MRRGGGAHQRVLKMTLEKEAIFKRVMVTLGNLAQHVQNIDGELLDILHDMSAQGNFLSAQDTSLSTTASTAVVDASALLIKSINEVWISGDNRLHPGSYQEYLDAIEQSSSPPTGEPKKYVFWNDNLYVYDWIPDDEYTLTVDYYKYHAASVDAIEYADRYRMTIVHGVLMGLWDGVLKAAIENKDYAEKEHQKYFQLYLGEIEDHKKNIPSNVILVEYRDL